MYKTASVALTLMATLIVNVPALAIDTTTLKPRDADIYATFYNDNACTQGAGQAVDITNPGCLANEYGRNSIYFQSGFYAPQTALLWSPGNTCDCQNNCVQVSDLPGWGSDGFCYNMNGNPFATSFRFIEGPCPPNNC